MPCEEKCLRVLVTGGSGFLGINLIRHLLETGGRDIVSLDIAPFDHPEKNRITVIRGDIRDGEAVAEAARGARVIVHCAAALPLYSRRDIISTDIGGTRNLLEAALKNGAERFVHISSTAVYGVPKRHPIYEDDPLRGVGPYGRAKIAAEKLCESFRTRGLCVAVLRPKSFVGPERLGVFALLYGWALEGRGFPLIGSGANRYQLLDVDDLCRAIRLCMTVERRLANDTYNIGAREFATMREDFQTVLDRAGHGKRVTGFPAWLAVPALRLLEILRLSPLYGWVYRTAGKDSFVSVEKAERQLGFVPRYANREALIRNFEWYRDNMRAARGATGITHRASWDQGILKLVKGLF